jgi:DNA-binding GntR family transcriptional regulator
MARARPNLPGLASTAPAPHTQRGAIGRGAYETIRAAVLDCTFVPGTALSEQAVSEQLQVSRAPVREAFRQLVVEGLLEVVPQRGTFVARLDRARIGDAVFVREAIECKAAELAAAAPLAQRKQLAEIVKRQASAAARRDYATHLSTDEEFHQRILHLAGHPHAWNALRLARTGMNRIRHLAIPTVGSHKIAIDHHRAIVEAILDGDARAAVKAMRLHIHSPMDFVDAIEKAHPEYFE